MIQSSYSLECDLVSDLCGALNLGTSPWPRVSSIAREFDYQRGRTDVIAMTSPRHIVAFEAKLLNWRKALHQAYRNTCFAHESYVVVPRHVAVVANCFAVEFERRAVGLCSCDGNGLEILIAARRQEPIQDWLLDRAITHMRSSNGESRSN